MKYFIIKTLLFYIEKENKKEEIYIIKKIKDFYFNIKNNIPFLFKKIIDYF